MSLLLGRFDLMIPSVCFKGQRHIIKGIEHIFVVSSLGESAQEVMSVHTVMRCLKQGSYLSRTLKTDTMGKHTSNFRFVLSIIMLSYSLISCFGIS